MDGYECRWFFEEKAYNKRIKDWMQKVYNDTPNSILKSNSCVVVLTPPIKKEFEKIMGINEGG